MKTHTLMHKRVAAVAILLAVTTALTACSSGSTPSHTATATKVTKLAYIVKYGTVPYFVAENKGVQAESKKLGITTTTTDVEDDSNAAISAVDTAIGQGAQGLIVVPPNQNLGPAILAKAAAAHIPVISVDDPLVDGSGKPDPFVGFDAAALGTQVGNELATLVKKAGISPSDIKIASVEDQTTPVCMTRNNAAFAALHKAIPAITDANVIHIPYNNDINSSISAVTTVATANPNVKYWLSYSCNDAGVLGAWRAFAAKGFPASHFFGVGLGGDYACQEFKENPTGVRASYYLDSTQYGETAVKELYDFLANGKKIPAKTILPGTFIDKSNYAAVAGC
jgi:L-arabinose transport system substrate-binding protein